MKCPNDLCPLNWLWDWDQDLFRLEDGTECVEVPLIPQSEQTRDLRDTTMLACSCGRVLGFNVKDEFGSHLFVDDDWNAEGDWEGADCFPGSMGGPDDWEEDR